MFSLCFYKEIITINVFQGSQTVLYCAASDELEKEDYWLYRDCQKYFPKYNFKPEISKKLWNVTEQMVRNIKKV